MRREPTLPVATAASRDTLEGLALGCLLGPLGVIVAGLLPTKAPSTEVAALTVADVQKKCPDCSELIKADAHVCRFCGRRFSDDEVGKAVAEAKTLLRGKAERDSKGEFPW
jgi:hypothetical protein